MSDLNRIFLEDYDRWHYPAVRWPLDPLEFQAKLKDHRGEWEFEELGTSEEGRPIRLWKWGSGPRKVLAWSQMHGNEPTASWAFLEILRFMESLQGDPRLNKTSDQVSLNWIPVLNPDGAAAFTRENARGVDINRDYHDEKAVETRLLKNAIESLEPDLALNLHDQRSIFTAGEGFRPAIMSFLSPSVDESRKINEVRQESMKLIMKVVDFIYPFIPGYIGRYTDEFYPNAFGDNLQASGIPTILFESGSSIGDDLRVLSRKLTAAGVLSLLNEGDETAKVEAYHRIPENRKCMRDVVFREVSLNGVICDLAFQSTYAGLGEDWKKIWKVDEIGKDIHPSGWKERGYRGTLELSGLNTGDVISSDLVEKLELG